jgi:hypothetical protein
MDASEWGLTEGRQTMLYFKSCPKCRTGTVEHSNDLFTQYVQCLNCGLLRDVPEGHDALSTLKQMHAEFRAIDVAGKAVEAAEAIA